MNVFRKTPRNTGFVHAAPITNPNLLFRKNIGKTLYSSPISTGNNVVLLVLDEMATSIKSINTGTGEMSWSFPVTYYPPCYWLSPAYNAGRVYVADRKSLIAISEHQGVVVQNARIDEYDWAPTASPVLDGHKLYISSNLSRVHAYDIDSLQEMWSFNVGQEVIYSCPCIYDDKLIFTSCGGPDQPAKVFCVNNGSGKEEWRFETDEIIRTSVAAADGKAYVRSGVLAQTINAIDIGSGRAIWQIDLSILRRIKPELNVESSVAVASGLVVGCTVDGRLYAINSAKGTIEWDRQAAAGIESSPLIVGTIGYVCTIQGEIIAFDIFTGNIEWSYLVGAKIYSSPEIANGILVVATISGELLGFTQKNVC